MFAPAAWHVLSFRRGFRRGFPYAFGERYPLCLEHLCLLSRCKRSLDYLNVRHVANTCASRGKHQFVMLAYTRLPCGKHPHSIQAEDVLSALCNFLVSERHEGRRVYIPGNRLHNTFEQRPLCRSQQKCVRFWGLGFMFAIRMGALPCAIRSQRSPSA